MELELHQLSLRYEHIRKRVPKEERALLASMAEIGQQLPIVVVSEANHYVLIDGYKRVRALKRLARDTARVTCWQIGESEALLLERTLRSGREDALEQGWLLTEMQERFGLSLEQLAQRFGHSKSWVSRAPGARAGAAAIDPGAGARGRTFRACGHEVSGALGALGGIARRAYRVLHEGLLHEILDSEREEVQAAFSRVNGELERLVHRMSLQSGHAG